MMNKFTVHIPTHILPVAGQKVCLAVSGGVDSVVLLDLLMKARCEVHLLHVNYHLRGEDSIDDEKLVRRLAAQNQLKISVLNFDMKEHLARNGGNLQNEARKIRYVFFNEHLTENDILMTAHHLDDQMETFFMHLSRKSGIAGMSCMAQKNGNHYRPLLGFRKSELYHYAKEHKLEFREDVSNTDNKYLRNLWRNVWIPLMEKEVPELASKVQILVRTFQNERKIWEEKYAALIKEIRISRKWSFAAFDQIDEDGVYLIGKNLRLTAGEIARLIALRTSEKSKFIFVQQENVKIWNDGIAFIWDEDKTFEIPKLKIEQIGSLPKTFDKYAYYADANKIVGELSVRPWREGDKIAPIGMVGTQLVSDIIKDAKVSSSEKTKVLVVEDDEKIVWVVGLKMGRLAVANAESKNLISIKI
jgi:tRNA(Ile)-lysidine synthase